MKNLISGMVLAVILCGLYATAQQPHVTTTLPSATVKLNGASGGGGSGTGFTYDAGDGVWVFEPPSGTNATMIRTDDMSFNDSTGATLMQILPAASGSGSGVTTYFAGRLAAAAIEQRVVNTLSATGTIVGANVLCSTGGGAVVGTLDASAGNVGRFVYVTRDGANTCTIGVASGQTLDGVTDGTTTVPSAGWKTFVQTTSTAWVTAGSYPVTGTLSGLTATRIPVATSATAVGDSAITHVAATGVTTFGGSGPALLLNDYAGAADAGRIRWNAGNGSLDFRNSADSGYAVAHAGGFYSWQWMIAAGYLQVGDTFTLYDDGSATPFGLNMKNGAVISWPNSLTPDTQIQRESGGVLGIYAAGSTYGRVNVNEVAAAHYLGRGSTPSVGGSCGTGPAIAGRDAFISVTTGSGSPTSCVVTFATAYATAPVCNANASTTTTALNVATTTTTVTVSAAALTAAEVLHISCGGF